MSRYPWHVVHIGFIIDLPEDEGCSTVMTIGARFLKMCSFVPLSSTIAASVETTFFKEVVVHYGVPRNIFSDHDTRFTSESCHCLMSTL